MDKHGVEAQIKLDKLNKKLALEDEFNNLRPSLRGSVLRLLSTIISLFFVVWLFPEVIDQPVSYVLLLLIFGTSAEIFHESRRINKRMDTLYRLLKNDA
ncbi:hypothetical protein [Pseudoalteromonas sp. MMG005]|uniref:hypothetical protein n=1 Tax=Pseudoalteromonas sp. MMG005 TaxID=2822682 RepID=UPI001B3A26AB|nr:hypothetical protein [Pseudoalteromonas sp. MMG005]MBQ4847712.1 hypothetical protein [Pseudoalteromonas sp. MMG005]